MLPCKCDIRNKVTIIIPTENDEDTIGELLDDISNQYYVKGTTVIVVDNNSTDNTLSVISDKKESIDNIDVKIMSAESANTARNKASKKCSTKYIFFIDADVRLNSKWLFWNSFRILEEGKVKLITAHITSTSKRILSKIIYFIYNLFHKFLMMKYPYAAGAFFCLPVEDFEKNGRFDEQYSDFSDFLFSQNFTKEEFKVLDDSVGKSDKAFDENGYINSFMQFLYNVDKFIKGEHDKYKNRVDFK